MATWQMVLVILGCVVAGFGLGLVTISIIIQLKRNYRLRRQPIESKLSLNQNALKYIEKQPLPKILSKAPTVAGAPLVREGLPVTTTAALPPEQTISRPETPPSPEPLTKSEIYQELEHNLMIATSPQPDILISFLTKVWDSHDLDDDPIMKTRHEELVKLYADIQLANMIIVLARRLDQRTTAFNHSYLKLCNRIAEQIKTLITT